MQSATRGSGDRLSRAQSSDLSGGNTCARWTAALGITVPLIIQLTADEVIEEACSSLQRRMSAFWHKADIPTRSTNVRFWG